MEILNLPQLVQDVFDGQEDPLKAYAIAKEYEKSVKECLEALKEAALEEASTYEKNFEHAGFKFERRDGKATYSYKHIDSWNEANNKKKHIETTAKDAFKAYSQGKTMVDDQGEVIEPAHVTYSSDSLVIKKIQ